MAYFSTLSQQPVFYNGAVVVGAKIYVYDGGTNTPRTAYTNEALTVAHPSPFLTNSNGNIPAFWVSPGANIKVIIRNTDDTIINTIDGIPTLDDTSSSLITDATAAGRALLTAASAAAQRTALGATTAGSTLFTAADAAAQRTALGASAAGNAIFTAADAAAQRTSLGGTSAGSAIFTATDAAAQITALGLGTAATQNTGNTANTVPLLDANGQLLNQRVAASAGWGAVTKSVGVSNESGVFFDASNNAEIGARNGAGSLRTRWQSVDPSAHLLDGLPAFVCRAWVNFNGTGTVAIRASGNVTSITDNGTGDYTVNFTTAMPDANYSVVTTCQLYSSGGHQTSDNIFMTIYNGSSLSVGFVRVNSQYGNVNSGVDPVVVCVSVFR